MSKKRTPRVPPSAPEEPAPLLRAWTVVTASGTEVTVSAHDCTTFDGVLVFDREDPKVLVAAFAPGWREVHLLEPMATRDLEASDPPA